MANDSTARRHSDDTRTIERRAVDRFQKRVQLAVSIVGGLLSAIFGAGAIYLALHDRVSSNTNVGESNATAIARLEGQLQAQQAALETIKANQADVRAGQKYQSLQLDRIEGVLDTLAKGK